VSPVVREDEEAEGVPAEKVAKKKAKKVRFSLD